MKTFSEMIDELNAKIGPGPASVAISKLRYDADTNTVRMTSAAALAVLHKQHFPEQYSK